MAKKIRNKQPTPPLYIISGPMASGKSTFLRAYHGKYSKHIRLDAPKGFMHCRVLQWLLDFKDDPASKKNVNNTSMIEYNIMRVYKHIVPEDYDEFGAFPYDGEAVWQYLLNNKSARKRMQVLVLALSPSVLIKRVKQKYKGRPSQIERFSGYYTAERLTELYDKWLTELNRQGLPHKLINFKPPYHKIAKISEVIHV